MSVIVKDPSNGQITCYTKGADSSVYNNLSLSKIDKNVKVKTDEALEVFAQDGLRTLVYGKRDLDKDEYDIWQKGEGFWMQTSFRIWYFYILQLKFHNENASLLVLP